ncbi:6-aminohexanoate-dimer hydrolase [Nostocoides japonicum T1-X7]|uniref:6-aminohexanoate-dimer hydrolase n=1 Tax=Nostocoides japonicum T1-X7 TaxID=1194083 RepID=A0A077M3T2_9MICO|nr:serine hydrolase [Tetrasphaera japonica]CCH79672.1 6-aminohexanoate-dimer hydrolase [Tetrasphaera japonica T1-X7]
MPSMMRGFPTEESTRVTLDNWQEPDSVQWSFRHMRELMGSQRIAAGVKTRPLPEGPRADLSAVSVSRLSRGTETVQDVIDTTHTDALVVLHDGALVAEWYAEGMSAESVHLMMSCSKSIVGCVAGILTERGLLDPSAATTHYVPEVDGSGYGGTSVRDLLDMRTGVAFSEAYTNPDAQVRVMERSMGWRPIAEGDPLGAYAYLASLERETDHGGVFTYRSADTDMLGWVCERAAGVRMADLISELVWRPIGAERDAEITCDTVGTAIHDGGVSATARDMARFGQMLLEEGIVDGAPVVPSSWIQAAYDRPEDVRKAFAASDNEAVLPGGWYRSQFWFVPGGDDVALVCLGIHGQMVFVHPSTRLVAVKQSSWPAAQDVDHLVDTLRAFRLLGTALAGR